MSPRHWAVLLAAVLALLQPFVAELALFTWRECIFLGSLFLPLAIVVMPRVPWLA